MTHQDQIKPNRNRRSHPNDDITMQAMRLIETARWHIIRYDNLRSSLATRASFTVSVDAVLIAGISFLFSYIAGHKIYGGTISLSLIGSGMLVALIYALLSVRDASQGLLSSKTWRILFGDEPPHSLFYQHSDTIKATPSYREFSATFKGQTLESEAESAIVNLWLVLRTHAHRYKFIRAAIRKLQF